MNEKKLRHLLKGADDKAIEQIADLCPPSGEDTQERIYQSIAARRHLTDADTEHLTAEEGSSHISVHYLVTAAACFALCAAAAGGVIWMQGAGREALRPAEETELTSSVEIEETTEETEPTTALAEETPTEAVPEEITKAYLYDRCRNSLRYIPRISGSVKILDGLPISTSGSFSFDFDNDLYWSYTDYSLTETGEPLNTNTVFKGPTGCTQLVRYATGVVFDGEELKDELILTGPDYFEPFDRSTYGDTHWGDDPTEAHQLAGCFMPLEMTEGYLKDLNTWEITGSEVYEGRECSVCEGTTDDSYGGRWGVVRWKTIIDNETGVWLFHEGYDEDGNVKFYIYTEDIRFGDEASEVPVMTEEKLEGVLAERDWKVLHYPEDFPINQNNNP